MELMKKFTLMLVLFSTFSLLAEVEAPVSSSVATAPVTTSVNEGVPAQAAQQQNPLNVFFLIGGILIIFYLFLIRPQQKQQKKRDEMLKSLVVGDKVVLTSGIYAEIKEIKDNSFKIKVDNNTTLEVTKSSIGIVVKEEQNK